MTSKALAPIAAALLLAGCAGASTAPEPAPAPPPPSMAAGSDCDAAPVETRIGQRFTTALGETLQAESGATTLRVLRPGGVATLDYSKGRLNVRLDERDIITAVDCG